MGSMLTLLEGNSIKDLAVPVSSLVRQVSVCWVMLLPFGTKFVTLEPPIFTAIL